MSAEPFLAEIALYPYNFAPKGWARCEGQLMPINQNTALFSLLGTTYGGDGKSTFALPDLSGAVAMAPGDGLGLSLHDLGEQGGSETVTLLASEMPAHTHALNATPSAATSANPALAMPATSETDLYHSSSTAVQSLAVSGGSQPHQNMQPYLTLCYCIALQGIFPSRP
jgi:microcystin-dependent protein